MNIYNPKNQCLHGVIVVPGFWVGAAAGLVSDFALSALGASFAGAEEPSFFGAAAASFGLSYFFGASAAPPAGLGAAVSTSKNYFPTYTVSPYFAKS